MLLPRVLRPLPSTPAEDAADVQFGKAPIVLLRLPRGGYAAELCRRLLEQTLGTDPQAETTRLYRAVRTGRLPEPVLTT